LQLWYNRKGKRLNVERLQPSSPQIQAFRSLEILGVLKMRLRRLEIIVIGVTLAFAIFMGGFFTGRNWSAVNVTTVTAQNEETENTTTVTLTEVTPQEVIDSPASHIAEDSAPSPAEQQPENPPEVIGAPREGDGRININIASQSELTDLPGIGNVLASRIVDYRRQHGDFLRIEDIKNVSGIGDKRFEAIQDRITVG
jgi:competence ComEA-like helix-hairpin-helix protein